MAEGKTWSLEWRKTTEWDCLKEWSSNPKCGAWLCPPSPDGTRPCLEIFLVSRGAAGISWVDTRGAAPHPTVIRTVSLPPAKNYPAKMSMVLRVRNPVIEQIKHQVVRLN